MSTQINLGALLFTFVVAVGTGILFGLAPALEASRGVHHEVLKEGGRSSSEGRTSQRLRRLFVVAEAALAVLLLAGSGLLLRSFVKLLAVDPGFRAEGVLTMQVSLPSATYAKPEQQRAFFQELVSRVEHLPSVQAAGAISALPLGGPGNSGTATVDSRAVPPDKASPETDYRAVMPGYFQAMGISLVSGRYFDERDTDSAPPVGIIDETMASTFWPNEDPVGKRIKLGGMGSKQPWMTIVGVVRHVHYRTLEARSRVQLYWPEAQRPTGLMSLAIRTSAADPMSLAPAVERLVQTFTEVTGIELHFEAQLGNERLPGDVETTLYRIVQEALTNVAKHAGARRVSILLVRRDESVTAVIEDDGQGFMPEEAGEDGGLGLAGMRERVALLDGRLQVESSPGAGTTIVAEVPLS